MALAYLEIDLRLTPRDPWWEIMIAQMGSLGFESFVDTLQGFKGYIPKNDFQEKDFLQIDVLMLRGWRLSGIPKSFPRKIGTVNGKRIFDP